MNSLDCPWTQEDCLGVECAWPLPPRLEVTATARQGAGAYAWIRQRAFGLVVAALLVLGLGQLGAAGYIHAKAWLAQYLIQDAWAHTLLTGQPTRPWPWADTWPVARLSLPGRPVDLYVLQGASGRTLAFGPGHVAGSAEPGTPGNTVIGGHRDTHFAVLRGITPGAAITLQDSHRRATRYRVTETRVVHKADVEVMTQPPRGRHLTLVTCYPFDALTAGGPLRYVVKAEAEGA